MKTIDILKIAAKTLDDKKAINIYGVKISELTVLTDYFLIANGTSSTHVRSLAEEVEEKLKEAGVMPIGIEGRATGWVLLDYGSVVIHVFTPEARDTYGLEHLWADGEKCDIEALIKEKE